MQQQVQQRASEHEQDLRAMSEQVSEWDRVSPSLPPSLPRSLSITPSQMCACVQLTVAREQATHAELKLYDVALEMHEKMTNQRDQLTSLFEVHRLS